MSGWAVDPILREVFKGNIFMVMFDGRVILRGANRCSVLLEANTISAVSDGFIPVFYTV